MIIADTINFSTIVGTTNQFLTFEESSRLSSRQGMAGSRQHGC